MNGHRIVNPRLDSLGLERGLQAVAVFRSQCVYVINVTGPGHFGGPLDSGIRQEFVVAAHDGPARFCPALEMA